MSKLDEVGLSEHAIACVEIFPEALEEEYVRISADMAYWDEMYSRALHRHLALKRNEKKFTAMLKIEHRERLFAEGAGKKSGSGRVTDSMVEAAVEIDDRMVDFNTQRVDAEVEMIRLRGFVEAIHAKKEMIVSIGAHVRKEMDGDPVVRAAHADAHRFRTHNR